MYALISPDTLTEEIDVVHTRSPYNGWTRGSGDIKSHQSI